MKYEVHYHNGEVEIVDCDSFNISMEENVYKFYDREGTLIAALDRSLVTAVMQHGTFLKMYKGD